MTKSSNGVVLTDRPVTWSTSAVAIASVSPTGLATGVTDGLATVTATSEGQGGNVVVDVRGEVASVTVSPPQASLLEPQTVSLTAVVRSRKGTTLTRRSLTWSTSDPAIAGAASTGALTALATGTGHGVATIRGTLDGVVGMVALTVRGVVASVVVTPATLHFVSGQSRPLSARTFSRNGVLLTDRLMTWTTSNPSVAVLTAGQVAQAVGAGGATIQVAAEGTVGTATVTVHRILLGGASSQNTCATVENLASYCWGDNMHGQLGNGTLTNSSVPVMVATSAKFAALIPLEGAAFGVSPSGQVFAWGIRLGIGTSATTPEPNTAVTRMAFSQILGGADAGCGLGSDPFAYCWGSNNYGQLGDGTTTHRADPGPPVGAGLPLATLSMGGAHVCGLIPAGKAYCWGLNNTGQLGDGTIIDHTTPVAVATAVTFVELAAGRVHNCGRTAIHGVYCWGNLPGTLTTATVPVLIGTQQPLVAITSGAETSCVLTTAGDARCWGYNLGGALGDGTAVNRSSPTPVAGGLRFSALSAGRGHTCGVTRDDKMYCWGINNAGQVGDRTHINRFIPTPVTWPTWP